MNTSLSQDRAPGRGGILAPPSEQARKNSTGQINEHILIEPGNSLCVMAKSGVIGRAMVPDEFPVQIGIYEMSMFLSLISMFRMAECDFQDGFARIHDAEGGSEVRYLYAAPGCVGSPPKKMVPLPSEVIEFDLPEPKWAAVQKAAAVLDKEEIRILSDGDGVSITTYDHKYPGGHQFSAPLAAQPHGLRCNTIIPMASLKLLKGSYHATVTPSFTVFKNTSGFDLSYWIACHPESSFG